MFFCGLLLATPGIRASGCEAPAVLALGADLDFAIELSQVRLEAGNKLRLGIVATRRWLPAGFALRARACVRTGRTEVAAAELELPAGGEAELAISLDRAPGDDPLLVSVACYALGPGPDAVTQSDDTPEDNAAELRLERLPSQPAVLVVTEGASHSLALAADEGRILLAGLAEAASRTDSVPATALGTWTLPALKLSRVEVGIEPPLLDYETGEVVLRVVLRAEGGSLSRVDYTVGQIAMVVQPLLSGTLLAGEASRAATSPVPFLEWDRRLTWKVGSEECGHPISGEVSAHGVFVAPDGHSYSTASVQRSFSVRVPEEACASPAEDEN